MVCVCVCVCEISLTCYTPVGQCVQSSAHGWLSIQRTSARSQIQPPSSASSPSSPQTPLGQRSKVDYYKLLKNLVKRHCYVTLLQVTVTIPFLYFPQSLFWSSDIYGNYASLNYYHIAHCLWHADWSGFIYSFESFHMTHICKYSNSVQLNYLLPAGAQQHASKALLSSTLCSVCYCCDLTALM